MTHYLLICRPNFNIRQSTQQTMGCGFHQRTDGQSELSVGDFTVLRQVPLAEGAFGRIWQCQDTSSGTIYALKQIPLISKKLASSFHNQVNILTKLTKNKLQRSISMKAHSIEMNKRIGNKGRILFQIGQTTLFQEINSKDFSEKETVDILIDITMALEELHRHQIYHMDIKPQNIVLVEGKYKICDFGSVLTRSINFNGLTKREKEEIKQFIENNSTFAYRSPELIDPRGKTIGASACMWMLGVIAYILAFGKHPFAGRQKSAILKGELTYPRQGFLTSLIRQLLQTNPDKRPSASNFLRKLQKYQTLSQ